MKTTLFLRKDTRKLIAFTVSMLILSGCQKDVYDPTSDPSNDNPVVDYFDFATSDVHPLSINYNVKDHRVQFGVFDINPLTMTDDYHYTIADVAPLFSGYTDWDSHFEGNIKLPSGLEKVYVLTEDFGMPSVYEVPVTAGGVTLTQDFSVTNAQTRADGYSFDFTYTFGSAANPYYVSSPLGKWDSTGKIEAMTTGSVIQGLTSRVQKIAPPTGNNSAFAKGKEFTNLVTYKETVFNPATGKIEGGTEMKVKFLWEFAGYHNVLGYYYYPKNTVLTEAAFKQLPKYLIFPNVSWDERYAGNANAAYRPDYGCTPLREGSTVALKYYGSNYDEPGTTVFPKDIVVGWMMMSDAFYTAAKGSFTKSNINGYLESDALGNKTHQTYMGGGLTTGRPNSIYGNPNHLPYVFSNEEFNTNKVPGCITLFDETSNTIVIGFEDGDLRSYQDMLFYVEATPGVINPGWAVTQQIVENPVKSIYSGALAFEDNWPRKGDYDMNDVIVNYVSEVTTNAQNNVTQLVDRFTVVNNGATYTNGFGYELGISPDAIESITIDRKGVASSFVTDSKGLEVGQNGKSVIMLFNSHKEALGKEIVVTIKIKSTAAIKLGTGVMYPPYNPFIVSRSNEKSGQGRLEVHLPKVYKPTALAGGLGEGDDASTASVWYISDPDKNSIQYPFALNIPFDATYKQFIPPTEKRVISEDYPAFINWVKSNGLNYKTWYKQNSKN